MLLIAPLFAALLQAAAPSPGDEKEIRAVLEGLLKAVGAGEAKAFSARFNPERLLDEIYTQAGVDPKEAAGRRLLKVAVNAALGQMGVQFSSFGGLGELHQLRLARAGNGPEIEASCLLKDSDGAKDRYRFWLARSGETWQIYDFESIHDGIRLSALMAAFVNEKGLDPAKAAALRTAGPLLQKLMSDLGDLDAEEALRSLAAIDVDALPPVLGGLMETLEGGLLSGLGREEEALVAYDRAVKRAPDLPRTHQLRWETCVALEKHAEAAVSAREFMRIVGDDAAACAVLGQALEQYGKPDEAEAAFRKGIAADADDSDCRYHLGLLLAPKKPAEARELLLAAIDKAEDQADRYRETAEALQEKDACAVLLELTLARLKKLGMSGPVELYYQGLALRRLGKPAEAEPVLRQALKVDEDGDEAWRGFRQELACALGQLGKFDEARKLVDEISGSDDAAAAYVNAFLHALEGKDAVALVELRDALKEDPDLHADAAREPAFAKLREGKELPVLLKKAKAKAAYDDKASTFWFAQRWDALRLFADARVKEDADDDDAWYHLGLALRNLGKHGEAEKALKAGIEKADPDERSRFREELGQALARGGKPAEALEQAALLLKDEAWQVEGHYVAALAHALSGKTDLALKSLELLFKEDADQIDEVELDAAFAEFRKSPEFAALVRRVRKEEKE